MKQLVLDEVKSYFRPELLNRFDEQIVFHKLGLKEVCWCVLSGRVERIVWAWTPWDLQCACVPLLVGSIGCCCWPATCRQPAFPVHRLAALLLHVECCMQPQQPPQPLQSP